MRRLSLSLLLVLATIATSCAVDRTEVESAITLFSGPPQNQATAADAALGPAEPVPTPDLGIETNELGQQLLPRTINGEFEADENCDFMNVDELPVTPDCGWLIRPLHGSDQLDIELPVIIFAATGEDPAPDPLIYLHGGPSDGILQFLEFEFVYELLVAPYVGDRDVIVFDQRGTGLAEPGLRCDSPDTWYSAFDEDPETFVPRTARICAFDLETDGIRLDQFSRQSSADDVMVLGRELGYEEFNILGSSWGGILGYTVMQLHPEWVRSSVLDSPLSTETDLTGSMPSSFQGAMLAMQTNCDQSQACADRHGDIVARYIRVFEMLEEEPRTMDLGGLWKVPLTADELSYLLFGLFYVPEAIAQIPDLLRDLENGDLQLAEELAWTYGFGWGIDFTFLTYMCTDIVPASSSEQVEAQQIGIPAFDRVDDAPDGRGHTAEALCERMEVRSPATPAMREVTPTTPTLVFSGSMDPITSFSSGQQIVDDIPNGTFVGFMDQSHGMAGVPCANTLAQNFLDDPTAELDVSCSLAENREPFEFLTVGYT